MERYFILFIVPKKKNKNSDGVALINVLILLFITFMYIYK